MWEYDDECNLKTTVREVQAVNIAGQDFSTILIHTTGNSDLGRKFDQKQWYEPNLELVVKSERTWSGDKTDWAGPGTQSGSTEKYELREVRFPDRSYSPWEVIEKGDGNYRFKVVNGEASSSDGKITK